MENGQSNANTRTCYVFIRSFDLKWRCADRSLYDIKVQQVRFESIRSRLLSIALVDVIQRSICTAQTANLDILGNIEILARTCPKKMALMVTLQMNHYCADKSWDPNESLLCRHRLQMNRYCADSDSK